MVVKDVKGSKTILLAIVYCPRHNELARQQRTTTNRDGVHDRCLWPRRPRSLIDNIPFGLKKKTQTEKEKEKKTIYH